MRIKRPPTPLQKRAKRGFRGYPIATIAFYGPDARRASKVAVGVVLQEDAEPEFMERWHSDQSDVRYDARVSKEVVAFIQSHSVKSVVLGEGIMGCPHEEGIDYPQGQVCPQCPYWANRDRWTGEEVE